MSGKEQQHTADVESLSTTAETTELTTLRQIVFGAAQADIDQRLAALEKIMLERFAESQSKTDSKLNAISEEMHKHVDELHLQLSSVDKQYDEKTTELQGYSDRLASELEMSDTNQKQDHDELAKRLDDAVQTLTAKYDARFAEALQKLEQVTKELSSSKTDRKTLAKLLATMAVNLETDEE